MEYQNSHQSHGINVMKESGLMISKSEDNIRLWSNRNIKLMRSTKDLTWPKETKLQVPSLE
jgi:hypothetical protein